MSTEKTIVKRIHLKYDASNVIGKHRGGERFLINKKCAVQVNQVTIAVDSGLIHKADIYIVGKETDVTNLINKWSEIYTPDRVKILPLEKKETLLC